MFMLIDSCVMSNPQFNDEIAKDWKQNKTQVQGVAKQNNGSQAQCWTSLVQDVYSDETIIIGKT